MKLDCCFDKPPTDSGSCSAYSKCTDQGLKGECCPAANGQYLNCCNEKPDFPIVGDSYCSCSYPLDFDCYQFGKPECCLKNSIDCPKEQPECEIRFPIVGDSYCEYSPDFGCYKYGRPECCRNDSIECPKERPECEIGFPIIGDSYCAFALYILTKLWLLQIWLARMLPIGFPIVGDSKLGTEMHSEFGH